MISKECLKIEKMHACVMDCMFLTMKRFAKSVEKVATDSHMILLVGEWLEEYSATVR